MCSEQMAKMVEKHNGNSVSGACAPDSTYSKILPYGSYNSSHSRYHELMEMHPAVKEAVLKMHAAIDRTPFKGVIGVGIREAGSFIWVFRSYPSTRRFVNRVKAYSESYERLRKHLVPTQFTE